MFLGSPSARRDETIFDAPDVKPLSFSEQHPKWTKAYATFGHKKKLNEFLTLGKIRLTSFVVVSAMGGHLIAPVSVSPSCFAALSVGVLLTSMSANSMNQFLEAPYDAQMARTQNRPLGKAIYRAKILAQKSSINKVRYLLCNWVYS